MLIHNAVITGSLTLPTALPITGSLLLSGSVGIGTAAPSFPLEISAATGNQLKLSTNDGTSANNAGIFLYNESSATAATRRSYILLDPNGANSAGGDYAYFDMYGSGTATLMNQLTTGTLALGTGGTSRLFITGSNVGIGTAAPFSLSPLHTYKAASSNYLSIQTDVGAFDAALRFTDGASTVYAGMMTGSTNISGGFTIWTGGAARLNITSAGTSSFGPTAISTAADAATITIKQPSTTYTNGIYLERSGERNGYYIYVGGAVDSLTFRRNYFGTQSDVMSLTRDGAVGIGTASPGAPLTVATPSATSETLRLICADTIGDGYISYYRTTGVRKAYVGYGSSNDDPFSIMQEENANIIIGTNSTERMRITTGGAATELVKISNSLASGDPVNMQSLFTAQAPNNQGSQFLYCGDSSALRLKIVGNGGIHNYQANNVNLSDINTKKDIAPLESYWDKFKSIEIVKFKYIDQTHDDFNIGVIAQQVEEIAPEFVDTSMWDLDGEEVERKAIYTSDLHHATIKVLQEAMTKIETLEARITALENK